MPRSLAPALPALLLGAVGGAAGEPLLLSPLVEAGRFTEARERSRIHAEGKFLGHSGYFAVPSASGQNVNQLFTWFQPCSDGCDPGSTPLIQWFNGGPGSPDTTGALNQIGNFYVGSDLKLKERCFSWCRTYNCLFVDSPVMTGFSFQTDKSGKFDRHNIEYTRTSADAARQVLGVLLQFLRVWPEYAPAPYYAHGLSYGGQYVPWMAQVVLDNNKAGGQHINIKGIAAGDPVMNNKYQYPTYASTLYAMGLVMEDERDMVEALMANATAWNDKDCLTSFELWNSVWQDDGGSSCHPNCRFLFKEFSGSSNTEHFLLGGQPDNFAYFRRYLVQNPATFHVEGRPNQNSTFIEGGDVYLTMVKSGDFCTPSSPLYTKHFLEAGLDVLVYSSNLDPLLGPPTTAAGVKAAWDYAEAFLPGGAEAKRDFYKQKKSIWRVADDDVDPAGYSRCLSLKGSRFCYVVVRNAGHETTSYAPRASFDLNERFLRGASFDGEIPDLPRPRCAACGGAPPLAGSALPACSSGGNGLSPGQRVVTELFM